MFKLLPKVIPALVFWGVFIYVVLKVPYPDSLTSANLTQLLSFFIPLFLAIAFTLSLLFKNIFMSASASLGVIFLLFLKALGSLNLVSAVLIIIPVGLLISYFRKIKHKGLTNHSKIPKLTNLRRQK